MGHKRRSSSPRPGLNDRQIKTKGDLADGPSSPFFSPDPDTLSKIQDKDFSVTDLACLGALQDGAHSWLNKVLVNGYFKSNLS
jgi:hypothetical protein